MFRSMFGSSPLPIAIVAAACTLLPSARTEDGDVIAKMTAGKVERIITSFSDVKNFKERGNNSYIFEVEGLKILLFNHEDSLQLNASFSDKVTMSRINEWNRTKRYTRAYLDKENDPVLQGDLELTGGVTEKNVKEWLKTYVVCLKAFRKHLAE